VSKNASPPADAGPSDEGLVGTHKIKEVKGEPEVSKNKIKEVIGFHVSHDGGKIRGNPGVGIFAGTTYEATGRLKMCEVGCHASFTLAEAHSFRHLKRDRIVSLVKVTGDVRVGARKIMGRNRKVLATKRLLVDPPIENQVVYVPGAFEIVEVDVIPEKFFAALEKELFASYNRNKRRIDDSDVVVTLAKRE
jgi:hypothetical protein